MGRPTTPSGRVSYPSVFKPTVNKLDKDKPAKYEITLLFEKGEPLTALQSEYDRVLREKWGGKPPKNLRSPFKDGDEKDDENYAGMTYVTFKSLKKPDVRGPNLDSIDESSGELYPGCRARVSFSCYGYEGPGIRPGVAFGLQNVQKTGDDDPFGSPRTSGDDDFEAVGAVAAGITDDDL